MSVPASSEQGPAAPPRPSRRAVLGAALGAALGGVGVPASLAAKPKSKPAPRRPARRRRRRPRYKVVTRTFHSGSAIVINDEEPASPYPSVLTVGGLKQGRLLDVNVTLFGFTHGYPSHVDLLLAAPSGRGAVIMSDVGGSTEATNLTIVLDDQASMSLPAGSPLVSGRFRPLNDGGLDDVEFPPPAVISPSVALATFVGSNPNGQWKVYLVDDGLGATGSLGRWALTIKARVRV